jgi:carboxymethylenebutenolidase
MCFDLNSEPPIFGQPCTQATGDRLVLNSADGATFLAFLAKPANPSGAGVLVLPDNRGLYNFYEQLTLRLAEQGHVAIAIDYFGRSAGTEVRGKDFPLMKHLMQLTRQGLDHDIETAAKFLRSTESGNCSITFALGFCFGGRQAFFASAPHFGFDGVIGFYGTPSYYPNGAPGPAQGAHELAAPLLGIFGGADHGIPSADVETFDRALVSAGVQHEFVTYDNAPHSFFDVKYGEFQSECADAWKRVCAFIDSRSSTSATITG